MFRKDTKFGASAALIALVGGDFNVRILLLCLLPLRAQKCTEKFFSDFQCFRRRSPLDSGNKIISLRLQ